MLHSDDYFVVKVLSAHERMNIVDIVHELIRIYLECKKKNYEAVIADLEKRCDFLHNALSIYQQRFGKIYNTLADKRPIGYYGDIN